MLKTIITRIRIGITISREKLLVNLICSLVKALLLCIIIIIKLNYIHVQITSVMSDFKAILLTSTKRNDYQSH